MNEKEDILNSVFNTNTKEEKEAVKADFFEYIKKRERELTIEDSKKKEADALAQLERERKNQGFTQLDDVGVELFQRMNKKSAAAGNLFLELAKQMDGKGALVVSKTTLADLAGVSPSGLTRLLNLMKEFGLINEFKTKGLPLIAMNPTVAWRSFGNSKQYAVFNANVLMDSEDYESEADYKYRRGRALMAIAKREMKSAKGKDKESDPQLPPPIGEEVETPEIVD